MCPGSTECAAVSAEVRPIRARFGQHPESLRRPRSDAATCFNAIACASPQWDPRPFLEAPPYTRVAAPPNQGRGMRPAGRPESEPSVEPDGINPRLQRSLKMACEEKGATSRGSRPSSPMWRVRTTDRPTARPPARPDRPTDRARGRPAAPPDPLMGGGRARPGRLGPPSPPQRRRG